VINHTQILFLITGVVDTSDKLITGVNNTGGKLITGVNDSGDKFIASVNDTCGKFVLAVNSNGDKHDTYMILCLKKYAARIFRSTCVKN
jgi:hypothetical protein